MDGYLDERCGVVADVCLDLVWEVWRQFLDLGLDCIGHIKRVGACGELDTKGGGRFSIKAGLDGIAFLTHRHAGDIGEMDHRTVSRGLDDNVLEVINRMQLAARSDRCIQLLAFHRGQCAELAGRHLGVLIGQGRGDVRGHQRVLFKLVWV